ncbi:leucine-rich repeat domain-containing protein [Natranaerobius thermophilus]|uniref:Bacterial repeat domain-containing protein n=1 Tax=Natranaerobius thermophilus (strain ATCC BAA-1301 / DSM 18059 / JW/NM-WN-LF) TaxID=457570 RepID=B2A432_NATTJ|nr:leucine-rich repeat domain-containing protein [Natranaerobius thermophilus]ACB85134.1 hypothetical protein Nther_1557 [Natranaerobius thermophilus JW/NM-WN-LF]
MSLTKLAYLLIVASLTVLIAFTTGCTPEYEVEVQADPEDVGKIEGEGIYEEGEDVTIEAEPEKGYEIVKWEKNGEEIDKKYIEFEIEENTEVVANFREIIIPDDNLKEAIRNELEIEGKLTKEDLKDLKNLRARGENISSLEGLQHAKNLEDLDIRGNEVTDVATLESINDLELRISLEQLPDDLSVFEDIDKLRVHTSKPEELYPLVELKDDTKLSVNISGEVEDISSLAELDNIVKLSITSESGPGGQLYDSIENFAPISELKSLKELEIHSYKIEDLGFLNLEDLQKLSLVKNDIKNIKPLRNLRDLEELTLGINPIENINALAELDNLEELNLGGTEVTDVSALSELDDLEVLQISNSNISDLFPLKNLENLRVLSANSNPISDISPLSSLEELEELDLGGTHVQDITPLKGLSKLKVLNLDLWLKLSYPPELDYTIKDISPLLELENLEKLSLKSKLAEELEDDDKTEEIINEMKERNVNIDYSFYSPLQEND